MAGTHAVTLLVAFLASMTSAQYGGYYYPRPPYNPYYPVYNQQRPQMVLPQERPVWQSGWVNVGAMEQVPRIPIYQSGVQLTEGGT